MKVCTLNKIRPPWRDSSGRAATCEGLHVRHSRGTASANLSPSLVLSPGSAFAAQDARADTLQSITQRRKLRRGRGWGYPVNAASWMAVACLQGRARPTDRPTASAGKAPNQACPGQGEALPILPPSLPPASVQGGQVPGIVFQCQSQKEWGKRSASGRRRSLVVKAGGRGGHVVNPSGLSICPG